MSPQKVRIVVAIVVALIVIVAVVVAGQKPSQRDDYSLHLTIHVEQASLADGKCIAHVGTNETFQDGDEVEVTDDDGNTWTSTLAQTDKGGACEFGATVKDVQSNVRDRYVTLNGGTTAFVFQPSYDNSGNVCDVGITATLTQGDIWGPESYKQQDEC